MLNMSGDKMKILTPEYLYSDELGFELRRRGIKPGKSTEERRKQLRGANQDGTDLVDFEVGEVSR